ncbi:M16 family metallopeptidase [Neptunicella sp. SCSIO 80796]|uniref:M16 family metallopeptidase n=1 Tax=Neptunicella plasticusilytica TaxID=3117012 RepID=UPI003A4DB284
MKMICKRLILLVSICWSNTLWAADFTLPEYQKIVLDNGLTVYLMEQHEVPLIDVLVTVKAGAVQDGNKAGLAKLTAENLLLGTKDLAKADFEAKLDFIGAQINVNAGLESTFVQASFVNKDTDLVMGLLHDAVLKPAFSNDEFDKHKQRYLAGLLQQKESPKAVIKDYFNKLLFKDHPYSVLQDGDKNSINTINSADIKAFHQRWYTPDNTAIVLVGDFDTATMLGKVKSLFTHWQGQAPAFSLPDNISSPSQASVVLVNKSDAIESTFIIGGPGIKRSNPDYVAISVINTILGGRFTSWLNDELRVNSGLTYGARSTFDARKQAGSFYISTFTKSDTTEQAIDLALETYARLWGKGIDQQTLDSAKAYVKGQFPPNYETSGELASLLANMFIYGFDERFINTFNQQVNALDVDKAKQIINRYFPKDNLQMVVIGKADAIRDTVKKYGHLSEADITDSSISF